MSDKQKNLIIRAITGVFYVAIMVCGFLDPQAMILLFALITGMTIWEFTGLINAKHGVTTNQFISTIAGVYFFLAVAGWRIGLVNNFIVFVPYLLTIIYLFISELYFKNQDAINDWAYTMLSQMYIALPFAMINIVAFETNEDGSVHFDTLLPLSIFVFLWINDTGAYCSGSLFGKHKLFPRISPAKSWEGSIGGGIFVLIAAGILGYYANFGELQHSLNILEWMGLGLIVVFFGTWGDLVESLFKRTLGIKDSGNILPGHGGMLDRFDSSLMAIPAAVVYLYTLQLF
ncbi:MULTISPECIES: phosphatidate cytidylyltransferase [Segatella]|jgi:phosphatidate cytidylyltransferase|uniref:Phosphatidate cytidylyltransferase n=2 Tax=Segatella TaxID=2974251 RepID=D8DT62_9BACT|nr:MULTISPECIES: phosphatidate cytidylyltransferase [Segatella]MBQ3857241.1 phosphatidate cytidylyltransferase [Prevotella sp.]EFI73377.1 phosphatidate cytidylyltransferase [Segatella baroniae B14]MDR4929692.1 phosphatidate cytidylyltransferase [Segatella bryantii]MEE3415405.1 phosphatidate cytidylyltransferase [Prevotella sp.]OYP56409.1 phosphatidate cytidylyltransferase [Segatella bryantii]